MPKYKNNFADVWKWRGIIAVIWWCCCCFCFRASGLVHNLVFVVLLFSEYKPSPPWLIYWSGLFGLRASKQANKRCFLLMLMSSYNETNKPISIQLFWNKTCQQYTNKLTTKPSFDEKEWKESLFVFFFLRTKHHK